MWRIVGIVVVAAVLFGLIELYWVLGVGSLLLAVWMSTDGFTDWESGFKIWLALFVIGAIYMAGKSSPSSYY